MKKRIAADMAIHILPESEPELHICEPCCPCEPVYKGTDEESGEMVWVHFLIDAGRLVDNLIEL